MLATIYTLTLILLVLAAPFLFGLWLAVKHEQERKMARERARRPHRREFGGYPLP